MKKTRYVKNLDEMKKILDQVPFILEEMYEEVLKKVRRKEKDNEET